MITAEQKPIEEIRAMIEPYQRILVLGCGSCVAECAAGGEKETGMLASALRMAAKMGGEAPLIEEKTVERQCVKDFILPLDEGIDRYEAVLSLGCGAGVQAVAELFPELPVIPALNTKFIGETRDQGYWVENCVGCGDCMLYFFGGVCPLTRCAKQLLNGACGGSKDGKCEVNPDAPCAWQLIFERLSAFDALERLEEIYPPKDWSRKQGLGPRTITREDQQR
jgi:ferredoxin